ncbi:glycosyl transferase [Hesseltinella vesiculosa]|uniref:Glycosyl transferase n=1 Tax=Hesseltinella vesiculosa TaxID=101127 RepID=A0A1X2G6I0_9FUNG|nr:glycosyl transferase [Hesseltinella vesiculosa]
MDSDGWPEGAGIRPLENDRQAAVPQPNDRGRVTGNRLDNVDPKKKVKACIVILARDSDLQSLRETMRGFEDRFNRRFHYPYVILNEEPFTEEFKNGIRPMTDSEIKFGQVPKEASDPQAKGMTWWGYPPFIDQERAARERAEMGKNNVPYGDKESYHHMCRFQSGFFFRHPLLDEYEYYWRVEPHVKFFCDIDYDVFQMMKDNDLKYGFNIAIAESPSTIPTLWETVMKFVDKHPELVKPNDDNVLRLISSSSDLDHYNGCHFWSNFEIGSLDFFRSPLYLEFFNHLDQAGGFFYERWGDAPVHSIAAALMLKRSEIHFFNDIGYQHFPLNHCPSEPYLQKKCICNSEDSIDWKIGSCLVPYAGLYPDYKWDEETYFKKTNPYRLS